MKRKAMMGIDKIFNRKDVERILLSRIPKEELTPASRRYIKQIAASADKAYQMGLDDALRGKERQKEPDKGLFLGQAADKELLSNVLNLAFTVYGMGYDAGILQRRCVP